ncbi:alginate export family protein [Ghiorsea bivora]|uniref:alginate export family protein n=1 Tax=Ghiorsea bivora TaxID=1485545 RepID=UPI00056F318E|nr:alginate export family protein [Ghiorsea bivora]
MLKKGVVWMVVSLVIGGLQAGASEWQTSVDLRERYQSFDNFDFNSSVDNNAWELDTRLYIKAKRDFDNGFSVYLQPQAVSITQHTTAAGTQKLSQADLLQSYLGYESGTFSVRIGRQQLVYGDQRLLGHLGWKDVARTFDGIKAGYKSGDIAVDAFVVSPADIVAMTPSSTSPRGASLVTWDKRVLTGVYGTYHLNKKTGADAYLINWKHNDGIGRNMNTYGTRGFGVWGAVDATVEAVFQSGTWVTGVSQRASAYAAKAGYMINAWKTRFGIEYDYSPGDDNTDVTMHKNFVFPFHTNHAHYGEMDRFSWANMKDIRLSVKTSPTQHLTLHGNVHFLSLDKAQGDWLNVAGTGVLYAGNAAYTETDAGTEIDLKLVYKVANMKALMIVANYAVFNPGAAVQERTGAKDSAAFAYLIANYKF